MNENQAFHHLNIDFMEMLRHQRRAMATSFVAILLVALAYVLFAPKVYTSEAKLFVRVGHESVTLDPTATTGQYIGVTEPRENEINSIFELLKSRGLLEHVAERLGNEAVLERDPEEAPSVELPTQEAGFLTGLNLGLFTELDDTEAAFRRLVKKLSISVVKKTNVINLTFDASTPEWAREALSTYIDLAREAHIRANRTPGSQEFFTGQVEHLRVDLTLLEARQRELKDATGIADLLAQRNILLDRLGNLENRLLETEAEQATAAAQIEAWQRQLAGMNETIVTGHTTGLVNTPAGRMREQLYTQEMHEEELLSRMTEEHPMVAAAHAETSKLRDIVAHEPTDPQVTRGPNPSYDEIRLALLKQQAATAGLAAEAKELTEQRAEARAELSQVNRIEVQLAELEREIDLAKAKYKKNSENLEQARIDAELQTENISNLNVLESPTLARVPSRPRQLLSLFLGGIAGLFAAAGVGLYRECRRTERAAAATLVPASNGQGAPLEPNGYHTSPA